VKRDALGHTERVEFLKNIWMPYPSARANWLDVAEVAAETISGKSLGHRQDGWQVAGRLEFISQDKFILSSGGAQISVYWGPQLTWLEPQREGSPFCSTLLRKGDLVCVKVFVMPADSAVESSLESAMASAMASLSPQDESLNLEARKILLLAPGQANEVVSSPFSISRSREWADFVDAVRGFFNQQRFIEAATPTLVPSPGTEPFLDPFRTEWQFGSIRREYFLPTSPEFHLKKMLTMGWTRIFEFKSCFRNGEISEHHQPEFLMLEWYRAYSNLKVIANDVESLIGQLAAKFCPEKQIPNLKRTTISQLFKDCLCFSLTPQTTRFELLELAKSHGLDCRGDDSWDDIYFRLFLEKIESKLGMDGPVLVSDYPPSQAALARIGQNGFADRFEVYWRGLELANAFHELNDPAGNEERFRDDSIKKAALGKAPVPVDDELMACIRAGMPPAGGIALGMERLFMALFEIDSISETRAFSISAKS
jgi:lysyl-tRNA synthetase class 2